MAVSSIRNLIETIKQNNVKYPEDALLKKYQKAAGEYNMEQIMNQKEIFRQEIEDKIAAVAAQAEIDGKMEQYQKIMTTNTTAPAPHWDDVYDIVTDQDIMAQPPYVTQQAFDQINLELTRKGRKIMQTNTRPEDEKIRISALGAVGEKLVRWYLSTIQKEKIIEAFDPMDKEKDFEFENGETAEIKTQSPYYNLHAFAVKDNQLHKMSKVDHIYFVETPRHKGIASKHWTYAKRQEFVNGPIEDKKASDFECTVYVLHKANKAITQFITRKPVYAKDGTKRDMLLIPIDELEAAFTITQEKHVILLDRYSTDPIGLHE